MKSRVFRRPGARGCVLATALLAGTLSVVTTTGAPEAAAVEGETFVDRFDTGPLHSEWEIVNRDDAAWSVADGSLKVTGQAGDTYQGTNSAKNIFMVDVPAGDFTAEVRVAASVAKVYQGAGLIAWKDIDNYVRAGLSYVGSLSPSGIAIEYDRETDASFQAVSFTDRPASSAETLRLQRVGNSITLSYQDASGGWVTASSTQVTFDTTQVGLYALGALDGTRLSAAFDDFTVTAAPGRDVQPSGRFTFRGADQNEYLVESAAGLVLTAEAPLATLALTAEPLPDGSIHMFAAPSRRPVLVVDGHLALGQVGDSPAGLRLTDAGGDELYLRTSPDGQYAGRGSGGSLVLGPKAAAVTLRMSQVRSSTGTLTIDGDGVGAQIPDHQLGVFFEDINYAADGGLYAELVRNRSFEFNSTDNSSFTAMTGWQTVNGSGVPPAPLVVDDSTRLNEMNRNHFRLVADGPGDGLRNLGFNSGFALKQGATYDASVYARTTTAQDLTFRLVSSDGLVEYGRETVALDGSDQWKKYQLSLTSNATTDSGRLEVTAGAMSVIGLDMVSVMPHDRWVGKNGLSVLRKDLATEIAAMKPGFVRFPGGCIVNVNSMYSYDAANGFPRARAYQWKETIGPVEARPTNANFWGYNQSYGLGYYEYFTFAEDIGAMPLPVVPALLTGCGQNRATVDEALLQRHIQDALDLVEFANGDPSTRWGGVRASLGHPEPFDLTHIGVGNEENLPDQYAVNFVRFRDAIKAKYPYMKVISNSGPDDAGAIFETHWRHNRQNDVDMVDEHYYNDPSWFLLNNHRYDSYDRSGPKVFLGEYASLGNSWGNALAEASYMTALQRNADVVKLASYAPLLANEAAVQWSPDAIWFDNDELWSSADWEVQKLFGNNLGDEVVPSTFQGVVNRPITGGVFLSTWNTAAAYDNVKVTGNSTGEVLFQDSFGDSSQWQAQRGTWTVANGEYVQSATNVTDARSIVTDAYARDWSNYTLELTARKTAGSEGFLVGFGAEAGNDYYWWNIGGWNNTRSVLQKAEGGAAVEVKALEGRSITTGTTYRIKVVVSGNNIKLYLDDKLQMEYTSSADEKVFQVATRDRAKHDIVAKLVNTSDQTVLTHVDVADVGIEPTGTVTQLVAPSLTSANSKAAKNVVKPTTKHVNGLSSSFDYELPPYSVTFIRMHTTDGTAPVVDDVMVSGTPVNGWYANAVTVSATASDDRGVEHIEFRVDGGQWQAKDPQSASVQVLGDGQHTVEVRAVDAAGNHAVIRPVSFGIDTSPPVSNALVDQVARSVTVRAADAGSGVARVETRIGSTGSWQPYTGPVTVGDAETTVFFRATDEVGNVEAPGSVVVPTKQTPEPAATQTTATPSATSVRRGTPVSVAVTVTSADGVPTGTAEAWVGPTVLASGQIVGGELTLSVPTGDLAVGKHKVIIDYLGSSSHLRSETSFTLTVKK